MVTQLKSLTHAGNLPHWPSFEQDEVEAATRVLTSGKVNYWTGDEGREFEREFAAHTGTRHAVALANGSLALELALRVLRLFPVSLELSSMPEPGRFSYPTGPSIRGRP